MKKLRPPVRCSGLSLVMNCPGSHGLLRKLNKGPEVDSDASLFGRAYHEAMALATMGRIVDYLALQNKYGLSDDAREEVRKMVRRMPLDMEDWTMSTERELEIGEDGGPVKPGEQPFTRGHIDNLAFHVRIEGLAMVTDYKSGFIEPDDWQLIGYMLNTFGNFPDVKYVLPQYWFSRWSRLVCRRDENGQPKPYTRAEAVELWKRVGPRCREAIFGKRRYVQGAHCGHCAAFSCPSWSNWRKSLLTGEEGALVNREQAITDPPAYVRAVLPKLKVLQGAIGEIEEQLKSIVRVNGPVDLGNGMQYANRPQTISTVSLPKSLPLLLELNGNDSEALLRLYEKVSKDTLYEFAKGVFANAQGRMPKGKMKELMEALDSLNAIDRSLRERISVYPVENVVDEEV